MRDNFRKSNREFKGKEFDQNESVTKAGKKITWRTYIEDNNVDCEIYETLQKYGCIREEQVNARGIAGDFSDIGDLRTNLEREKKTKEMWESLPVEIRNEFNNDKNEFVDKGQAYFEKMVKNLEKKKADAIKEEKEKFSKINISTELDKQRELNLQTEKELNNE